VWVVVADLLRLLGGRGGAEGREWPVEWDGDSPAFLKGGFFFVKNLVHKRAIAAPINYIHL